MIQDLLKPRYKVIADWPSRWKEFELGGIICIDKVLNDDLISKLVHPSREKFKESLLYNKPCWISENEMKIYGEGFFRNYPHLFKKLEWWEERKPEEMPEYVRDHKGNIQKVIKWTKEYFIYEKESTNPIILPNVEVSMSVIRHYEPATEEEYLTYINNQTS